jgi:hypothetical protein
MYDGWAESLFSYVTISACTRLGPYMYVVVVVLLHCYTRITLSETYFFNSIFKTQKMSDVQLL